MGASLSITLLALFEVGKDLFKTSKKNIANEFVKISEKKNIKSAEPGFT